MKSLSTAFPEVKLIEIDVCIDSRGSFQELHHTEKYREFGITATFVQDNISRSKRGVLRGMHYQKPAQGKLVQVLSGTIWDAVIDIRPNSPQYGSWWGTWLTSRLQLWVPPGFAHGFLALTDATVLYKCTELYSPNSEGSIIWNDPQVSIQWPLEGRKPILSTKDQSAGSMASQKALARGKPVE